MTLGRRIKQFRMHVEETQRGLGEGLGVSGSTISTWERDKGIPRARNAALLCMLLGCRIEELLDMKPRRFRWM